MTEWHEAESIFLLNMSPSGLLCGIRDGRRGQGCKCAPSNKQRSSEGGIGTSWDSRLGHLYWPIKFDQIYSGDQFWLIYVYLGWLLRSRACIAYHPCHWLDDIVLYLEWGQKTIWCLGQRANTLLPFLEVFYFSHFSLSKNKIFFLMEKLPLKNNPFSLFN